MPRAVILGGAGFIGRWLCQTLGRRGWELVVIDLRAPELPGLHWVEADCREVEKVTSLVRPGDVVIHLFHSTIPVESEANPEAESEENVLPFEKLVKALSSLPLKGFLYASSGGQVYGEPERLPIAEDHVLRPISAYGEAKRQMEERLLQAHARWGLPYLIIRMSNPYGPFQERTNRHGVIPRLFRCAVEGETFILYGGGITVRDYIYIEDAVEAIARLLELKAWGHIVNIGTGQGTALKNLITMIETLTHKKIKIQKAPLRSVDVKNNVLDITRLHKLTGFVPQISLEQGLQKTWEYFQAHEKT